MQHVRIGPKEGPALARLVSLGKEVSRYRRLARERKPRTDVTRWLSLGAVVIIIVLLTSPFLLYRPEKHSEGDRIERDMAAVTPFRYELAKTRDEWELKRERFYKRIYFYDSRVGQSVLTKYRELVSVVSALDPNLPPAEMLNALRRQNLGWEFVEDEDVRTFVNMLRQEQFRLALETVLKDAYDNGLIVEKRLAFMGRQKDGAVTIRDVEGGQPLRSKAEALGRPLSYPVDWFEWQPRVRRRLGERESLLQSEVVANAVVSMLVRPNLVLNDAATAESKRKFSKPDLTTPFEKGAVLVKAEAGGHVLTREESRLLNAHRDAVLEEHVWRLGAHVAFTLLVVAMLGLFQGKLTREFPFTAYNVWLFALPIILGLGVMSFAILIAEGSALDVGYLFPAGAIGMLGVLLLDVRAAMMLVIVACLLFGLQVELNLDFLLVSLIGGLTAIASLYAIRKRRDVFLASIVVGVANGSVIIVSALVRNAGEIPWTDAAVGLASGIFSFLVLAVLPIFEKFGIVTDLQLLELTGLHHPLLRLIEEKAPGTWQHTLNVTKLAEAAATEIGVNYLLVRAGCYYHDIGKTERPEYFTENQVTKEDKMRHSQIKPHMSALIIRNHVKAGAELARREGLPERIIDFIRQHHGTHLIGHFYHLELKAHVGGDSKDPVREDEYRYPGPKPQTIEAAIVMLADSVEATATAKLSGKAVDIDDIQQVVRITVFDKFNDGQFDECNLTLRDLNIIREVFVRVLLSRFHTRVDYVKKTAPAQTGSRMKEPTKDTGTPSTLKSEMPTALPVSQMIPSAHLVPPSDPAPRTTTPTESSVGGPRKG